MTFLGVMVMVRLLVWNGAGTEVGLGRIAACAGALGVEGPVVGAVGDLDIVVEQGLFQGVILDAFCEPGAGAAVVIPIFAVPIQNGAELNGVGIGDVFWVVGKELGLVCELLIDAVRAKMAALDQF